jgi:ATP-dependent RNA helicase RhlE
VHRIGRTGRAGESGEAVSLVSAEDRPLLRDIERLIGRKIEERVIPGFEPGSRHEQPTQQQQRQPRQQQQRQGQQRQGLPRRSR